MIKDLLILYDLSDKKKRKKLSYILCNQILSEARMLIDSESKPDHILHSLPLTLSCSPSLSLFIYVSVAVTDVIYRMLFKPALHVQLKTSRIVALHALRLAVSALAISSHSWF